MLPARLYTELLTPNEEYRVHVFRGEVLDYSKKYKRVNGQVVFVSPECPKNRSTGWEYLRNVEGYREGVVKRAKAAVEALGLDFGIVDLIRHNDKTYVLEVNTACGLSPRGLRAYSDKIISLANN
jgi:predicted ATP-grasp superfamily ATP-dependent carboligase